MRSGCGKVTTEYIGTLLGSGFCASQARRTAGRRLATPPPSPASQVAPGKVLQQIGLVLLGVVGERRAADGAGDADDRGDAGADLGMVDDRLEDVGRALRVADQHEARRARVRDPSP